MWNEYILSASIAISKNLSHKYNTRTQKYMFKDIYYLSLEELAQCNSKQSLQKMSYISRYEYKKVIQDSIK